MIVIKRETHNWQFIYDRFLGVTSVINDRLSFYSPWNTGLEAQQELKEVERMSEERFLEYCKLKWQIFKYYI